VKPQNDPVLDAQAEELAALLDALVAGGSGHINLEVGEQTRVQTINSTECSGKLGACAVPTFFDDEEEQSDKQEDDEDW